MLNLLSRLWVKLSRHRRRQFAFLLGLMLLGSVAEIASLGLVIPFLGALTAPDQLFLQPNIQELSYYFGIVTPNALVVPLAILFATTAVLAGMIRLLLLWTSTKLSNSTGADLSIEIYRRTLYQPYQVHVERNSSEILSGIALKTSGVVSAVLVQILMFVSAIIIIISLMGALLVINPTVTLFAFGSLGVCYIGVTLVTSKKLLLNSKYISGEQTKSIKIIQEGLGGIRDIILNGAQSVYLILYSKSERKLRNSIASNMVISIFPKFILEALAMVLIAVFAVYVSMTGEVSESLPLLGVLALGAQRLLPMLQQAYASWAKIQGTIASLHDVLTMLDQPANDIQLKSELSAIQFEKSIDLINVSFRYSRDTKYILDNINLTIKKGSRVGFVGDTGSGKSTLVDVLMGLLPPVNGSLCIDEIKINSKNQQGWQHHIAHVPQSVYLSDNSLSENIAFGVDKKNIDEARVRSAAQQAQIAPFIENLPEGYSTRVGERGVRLSGGQCQRIGIARALYMQAKLLVFDEATSALDNQTEREVINSINRLGKDLTILTIAHRLTTVKDCDMIIELKQGKIVAQGTYNELLQISKSFRQKVSIA